MPMPDRLFLIRHSQSEANLMIEADKSGDPSLIQNKTLKNVPDNAWRITNRGVQQAKTAGDWIKSKYPGIQKGDFYVSPYTRTRETAANLNLNPNSGWHEHRILRERYWGELNVLSREQIKELYPRNWLLKAIDPLYWKPQGGESLADVSENRVASFLRSLSHSYVPGKSVVAVTHGEWMWAARLLIEYLSDEDFIKLDKDPNEKIHNCTVLEYSSVLEEGHNVLDERIKTNRFTRMRRAYPVENNDGKWNMKVGEWVEFRRESFSDEQLSMNALLQPNRF